MDKTAFLQGQTQKDIAILKLKNIWKSGKHNIEIYIKSGISDTEIGQKSGNLSQGFPQNGGIEMHIFHVFI